MSNISPLSVNDLSSAVSGRPCAFRCNIELQPAAGIGAKVFPPTYEGGKYAIEERRLPEKDMTVPCVLLDSVQSQANRMEAALQQAIDEKRISLPIIKVNFENVNRENKLIKPIDGEITSLTVPHRLADAILRDSVVIGEGDGNTLFRDSSYAERWRRSSPANATAIYELCPTGLVYGIWGAPEKPGGLGAKFQRSITSEIVAIKAVENMNRKGLRTDPIGVNSSVKVNVGEKETWNITDKDDKKGKRPSEINHGPIIFGPIHGGVTFDYSVQSVVLSLAGLRWLRFPFADEAWKPTEEQKKRDNAARTVIAAIALCGAVLAQENGYDLRSGCLLHPTKSIHWELLDEPGKDAGKYSINGDQAIEILNSAIDRAEKHGLEWEKEYIVLEPSDKLIELIRKSQEQTAEEGE